MLQQDQQFISLIVAGTIMLLLLGIFIITFLFFYQKKHNHHLSEKEILQANFKQILLQSQMEVREQTMQTMPKLMKHGGNIFKADQRRLIGSRFSEITDVINNRFQTQQF